ncbi:hypothetical protein Tco_0926658, partial [Tanacetum coccineum]
MSPRSPHLFLLGFRLDFRLVQEFPIGIKRYQSKVNLTVPTLTFPGIEEYEPYSIVDKPYQFIYLNTKIETVMELSEIMKSCDATLEKVLKEVKLKIFQSEPWKKPPLLGELYRDIMRAFEIEITKRLSHREQMRRWESFVKGRPILPTMKRLHAHTFLDHDSKHRSCKSYVVGCQNHGSPLISVNDACNQGRSIGTVLLAIKPFDKIHRATLLSNVQSLQYATNDIDLINGMKISFRSLKKSVVNIENTSTNKAFQVLVDPSRLQSPFYSRNKLVAPCHVLLSPKSRIHARIESLELEFLNSVIYCFWNTCQRSITELVYLIEPHDLLFIVVDREHYCSRRLNDAIIMLELEAFSIPSRFSEVQLLLVAFNAKLKEDDQDDLAGGADLGLQSHWDT